MPVTGNDSDKLQRYCSKKPSNTAIKTESSAKNNGSSSSSGANSQHPNQDMINDISTVRSKEATTPSLSHTNGQSTSSRTSRSAVGAGGHKPWRDQPHIGKYKLIRTLGRGNFAKVKLAEHVHTGRQVAVKVIDKTQLDPASLRKLSREVEIMKILIHPNIVRLYEVIESERHVYLVMEYAANGELFEYLVTNGRMKEKEAREKFRQLVSAVEYCHQKRIVHRDLKAENLLLDKDYNIKLADFGFSTFYDGVRKLDTYCGSPPYAAPELFQGQKYFGPEVDVWSLGVILYTLVSGSLPFDAQQLKELQARVIRGKYRVPFYMSTECELLLRRLLVLNPSKRQPLTTIMKDKWMNLGFDNNILQSYVEPSPDYNDPVRLNKMEKMGYKPDDVIYALEKRCFNNVTAIYLLLSDSQPKLNSTLADANMNSRKTSSSNDSTLKQRPNLVLPSSHQPTIPTEKCPKVVNGDNTSKKLSTDPQQLTATDHPKRPGVSWMKQSASAGPTATTHVTSGPSAAVAGNDKSCGLPRIALNESAEKGEPDESQNPSGDGEYLDTKGCNWLRRNSTFTAKEARATITGSVFDDSPVDPKVPLSRAPQFTNIPIHLTEKELLDLQGEPATLKNNEITRTEGFDSATMDTANWTRPAKPYNHRDNTFIGWLIRLFSCHRAQQKVHSGAVGTDDTMPITRSDIGGKPPVMDALLHSIEDEQGQFNRHVPIRATVGAPGHRQGGGKFRRPFATQPNQKQAESISASSTSTSSRVDTLEVESSSTIDSNVSVPRPTTPQNSVDNIGKASRLDEDANQLKMKLSATTTGLGRSPIQWSARYRAPGRISSTLTDASQDSSAVVTSDANTATLMRKSTSQSSPSSSVELQKHRRLKDEDGAGPDKSKHFLHRLTSRLSQSLRRRRHATEDKERKRRQEASSAKETQIKSSGIEEEQNRVKVSSGGCSSPVSTNTPSEANRDAGVADRGPWTPMSPGHRNISGGTTTAAALVTNRMCSGSGPTSVPYPHYSRQPGSDLEPDTTVSGCGKKSNAITEFMDSEQPYSERVCSTSDQTTTTADRGHRGKPRRLYTFHRSAVVGRDPQKLLSEAIRVLRSNDIGFRYQDAFCLLCTNQLPSSDSGSHVRDLAHPLNLSSNPGTPSSSLPGNHNTMKGKTKTSAGSDEETLIDPDRDQKPALSWLLEVYKLVKPSRYGIRLKHVSGSVDSFKAIERCILRQFVVT